MEDFSTWAPCWAQRLLLGNHLGHFGTLLLDWEPPPAVLWVFENFADFAEFAECLWHQSFQQFSCCVCGSGPTLGANIVFLANSFAATAGTNTRNTTFKIVHSDLLNKTWNVYQQYENVTIEVSHSSMFKIFTAYQY